MHFTMSLSTALEFITPFDIGDELKYWIAGDDGEALWITP